jgi:hypothetical protein
MDEGVTEAGPRCARGFDLGECNPVFLDAAFDV